MRELTISFWKLFSGANVQMTSRRAIYDNFRIPFIIKTTNFKGHRKDHEKLPRKIFYSYLVGMLFVELYSLKHGVFREKAEACFIHEGTGRQVRFQLPCNEIHKVFTLKR